MKKGLLIAMLSLGAIAVGGGITYACVSAGKQASQPETSEVIDADVDEEEQAKGEFEEWAKEKWDTYVVPAVGSVSVLSVISFVVTIVVTVTKEKKFSSNMTELKSTFDKTMSVVLTVSKINDAVANSEKTSEETKQYVKSVCAKMLDMIGDASKKIQAIDKIEQILRLLTQIQVKTAECSDIVMQSGVADDIREIKSLVKNL